MEAGRVPAAPQEESASRTNAPAPAAAPDLLGLQGRIGNRAVGRLLRLTDPRLTYTQKAIDEGIGLDATKLPFTDATNPDAGWNSTEILSKLTQVDESADTFTDPVRCGANSVLAIAINRGPRDTIAWARAIMRKALASDATRALGDKVWESISRLEKADATYGDLSNIAHHAKVLLSKDPKGATTGYEVEAMIGLLGGMQSSSTPMQDKDMLEAYVKDLKPGEAFIVLVDTDVLDKKVRARNLDQTNHYVVVGKTAKGQRFLYDPYPREGVQILGWNNPNFWTLFETDDGRWKSVYLFARPTIR
ncbi:MAG TPA: hypothetical protein VF196_00305 [Casimicrobiaceae bacterium]